MFLSPSTLPTYLASRGHIAPRQWFDEGFLLTPAPGRHANFVLSNASGSGIFIKQLRGVDRDLIEAQANEAEMLSAIQVWPYWSDQRSVAPRLIDHDRSRYVLIIDYIEGKSFYEAYIDFATAGDVAETKRLSVRLGSVLARFHQGGRRVKKMQEPRLKQSPVVPAAITLRPPTETSHQQLSPACRQLLDSIQNDPVFIHQLRSNASHWRPECVIHGDLKWDNVVVTNRPDDCVKLVDWELATFGDPAWDVAGVLQSFATHATDQSVADSNTNTKIHQDGDAFWASYTDSSPPDRAQNFTDRVRRFFAARLIQTVFEREQQSQSLNPVSIQLIQISRKILCESDSYHFPGN